MYLIYIYIYSSRIQRISSTNDIVPRWYCTQRVSSTFTLMCYVRCICFWTLYWFNCFNVIFLVQPGESSQKGPVRRVQSGRCMGGPARNVQPRRTSRKGPVMRVQPGRSRGVQPGRSNPKSSANSVQPRDLDPVWDTLAGSSKCPEKWSKTDKISSPQ